MFLYEITMVLSRHLQRKVKKKYKAIESRDIRGPKTLNELLDIELLIRGEKNRLSSMLRTHLVKPIVDMGKNKDPELAIRRGLVLEKVSALLFGPPGTSKTEVTKAIACETGWPLLTITPSNFVEGSFEAVYVKVNEIFRDMMDLAAVVIFFDEMDALMQSRERGNLDTATQFLTTVMLPKLAELHDNRKAIFFMATNHQDRFDPALKRAGRFDLLLCMGPPMLSEKLEKATVFKRVKSSLSDAQISSAVEFIKKCSSQSDVARQLELLTFAEFADFLEKIAQQEVWKKSDAEFAKLLADFRRYALLSLDELPGEMPKKMNERHKLLEDKSTPWIVRYLVDQSESSIH
jgi:SpoVK/Ycf46/Vps4 family AAA+-type ATPase